MKNFEFTLIFHIRRKAKLRVYPQKNVKKNSVNVIKTLYLQFSFDIKTKSLYIS